VPLVKSCSHPTWPPAHCRFAREALARSGVTTHDRRVVEAGASGECPRAPIRREASARKDALVIRKQKSGRPAMPTCCSFETSTLVASRLTPGSRRWSRVAYSVCEVIAEQQLDGFIDKFAPEMRGRIRDCRAKVQGRLPSAV